MHRHPASDPDADRRQLPFLGPDTGPPRDPPRLHPEVAGDGDEQFFEEAEVAMEIATPSAQVDDGIPDQLPRPVPGYVPPTVDPHRFYGRVENIRSIPAAADGIDRRMLQQEQGLRRPLRHLRRQLLLEGKGVGKFYESEIDCAHFP